MRSFLTLEYSMKREDTCPCGVYWYEIWKTEDNKWKIHKTVWVVIGVIVGFREKRRKVTRKSHLRGDFTKAMPFVLITDQWEWVRDAETWENISVNSKQKINGL